MINLENIIRNFAPEALRLQLEEAEKTARPLAHCNTKLPRIAAKPSAAGFRATRFFRGLTVQDVQILRLPLWIGQMFVT